jgi:hypothetical protein
LIAVLLFFFFRKTGSQFKKAMQYFTFVFLFLIVTDIAILVSKIYNTRQENEIPAGFTTCNDCRKPNIYLIIADEYAGRQELKDFFSFDNAPFENELRKRNFYVVPNPNSNYNYTPYSMASLFSMNYLKGITNKSNDIDNRNTSYRLINKNDLVKILKKTGYDFVNLSLFDFADEPTNINSSQF